jgi:hypothetical protein
MCRVAIVRSLSQTARSGRARQDAQREAPVRVRDPLDLDMCDQWPIQCPFQNTERVAVLRGGTRHNVPIGARRPPTGTVRTWLAG